MSGLFFASTLAAYASYARRPSLKRYLPVAGLFALGLLAKPTLVPLPFLLLLLDYWPLGRWRGAGSREQGAGSREQGAGSREQGAGSRERGAKNVDNAVATSTPWRLVLEKIPLLLLSVACSVAAVLSQDRNIVPLTRIPIPMRVGNAIVSYAVYLGQSLWPTGTGGLLPAS